MTLHFHGTPITPVEVFYALRGRLFCVSHARPDDVVKAHELGQSVMLDNGAFSKWKTGAATDWPAFYRWCERWLAFPTTWAVVPDVIDGGSQLQDALLREWPHGRRQAAPVWHMDEPLPRLLRLCEEDWLRVCIGSTAEYATVLSPSWRQRMDECWDAIIAAFGKVPPVHMLRGMQLAGREWPFASVDSTDIARNHNRTQAGEAPLLGLSATPSDALAMATRWDALNCPATWSGRAAAQLELLAS